MSKIILIFSILCVSRMVYAQGDFYDNSGKIYSVVAVVIILLVGIGIFLGYLDRKITKVEKKINDELGK